MGIIVDVTVPTEEFSVGEILVMDDRTRIVLECVVPLGKRAIPFVRVFNGPERFESTVRNDPSVEEIRRVDEYDEEILYAIEWDIESETLFEGISENRGTLLEARGRRDVWSFEVRFESHDDLSDFQQYCRENAIPIDVNAVYNPTKPEGGPWYGLTRAQRAALRAAVTGGYYSIPREMTTKDLAAEFDISDQAIMERLRRAIVNLVTNTLLVAESAGTDAEE